jgi:phage gpG-like protein
MYKDVMDHFGKEQGDTGSWKPLKYRVGKPLQDTGRLKNSIRPTNTKDTAVVGTNLVYAATHNYGRDNIQQRKFLWLSKQIIEQITKIIGKFSIGYSI